MKEIIITSSVLILCIILIRVIFKGKISSRLQYALWLLVALRLVIPVSAQINMAIGSIGEFRIMDLTKRLEARVGDVSEQLEQPVSFMASMNGAAGKLAAEYILSQELDLPDSDGPTSVFIAGRTGFTWLDVFRGIWIGGMIIVALWMIIANVIFTRRLHKGREEFVLPEDDKWSQAIRGTKIYTIEGLASPCLYGVPFREAIYLTPDIAEDTDRLRHVLTHEMCHKKHGDSFWSIVRSILLIIYWMNPLVWAAAVLSKRDCELACDEAALLILGEEERISYGETLLSIITRKGRLSDIACTATTMTGSGKSVKERIKYIAEKPRVLGVTVAVVLVFIVVAAVLVFTKSPLFHGNTWEGETVLTAGDMQVTLPESIAGISGYDMDSDGNIIIYQVASGEEAGRFCEVTYGEAVMLVEQGRRVVPIGDYGRNSYLKEYMKSLYSHETVTHTYTPNSSSTHNYSAPDSSAGDAGMLYHEEYYVPEEEDVPGTDSNVDGTTYIIDDAPVTGEENIASQGSYNNDNWHIPSPEDTDWEVIPLSEAEVEEEIKLKEAELKNIEAELARQTEQEAELARQAEQEAARELQEQERMLEEKIRELEAEIENLQLLQEAIKRRAGGVSASEDMYSPEGIGGVEGVPGTDSNDDSTTYVLEHDANTTYFSERDADITYIIEDDGTVTESPVRESIHYPTEETDGVSSIDYTPEEIIGESADYLPNEEITVTAIPGNTENKCYVYVKGDYSGVKSQYLEEMDYINSELTAVIGRVLVVSIGHLSAE